MKEVLLKLRFKKKVNKLQKKMLKQEKQIKKILNALEEIEPKGTEFIIDK